MLKVVQGWCHNKNLGLTPNVNCSVNSRSCLLAGYTLFINCHRHSTSSHTQSADHTVHLVYQSTEHAQDPALFFYDHFRSPAQLEEVLASCLICISTVTDTAPAHTLKAQTIHQSTEHAQDRTGSGTFFSMITFALQLNSKRF